jgi:hypothetical protein
LEFEQAAANAVLRQLVEREQSKNFDRPSGWKCARAKAFVKFSPELAAPITLKQTMTFMMGDIYEAVAVLMARSAGVDLRHTGAAQLTLDTMLGKGHPDGIVCDEVGAPVELLEVKSMADYGFRLFQRGEWSDDWGYVSQASAYAVAAHEAGLILAPRYRVVAVNKLTLEIDDKVFDADMAALGVRVVSRMRVTNAGTLGDIERPFEPKYSYKDGATEMELPVTCAYCDFKAPCWATDGFTIKTEKRGQRTVTLLEGASDNDNS